MFRILIFMTVLCLPFSVLAEPEPKCKKHCLIEGYYSTTCDAICEVDESLGFSFNIARKQFNCMTRCDDKKQKTLTQCIFGCRQKVRDVVISDRNIKIQNSIDEVERIIEKQNSEVEADIDSRITSKRIEERLYNAPVIIE